MEVEQYFSVSNLKVEIRQEYDKWSRWYNLGDGLPEVLGVKRLRRGVLQRASGKVLEVAVGTGRNLQYYAGTCQLTGVDFSPAMLAMAQREADRLGLKVRLLLMDAEALAFPDRSFDAVVSSLSVCTFPDPVQALHEMARVCRPGGRILLLEHGRSDRQWLGRWQDRRADRHAKTLGCRWNREPLDLVHQAGIRIITAQATFFGIFHVIEAVPGRQRERKRMKADTVGFRVRLPAAALTTACDRMENWGWDSCTHWPGRRVNLVDSWPG